MPLNKGIFGEDIGNISSFDGNVTVKTPSITSGKHFAGGGAYARGGHNIVKFDIDTNYPANTTFTYNLVHAGNGAVASNIFTEGTVTGQVQVDSDGNANVSYRANNFANYDGNTSTYQLNIINPYNNTSIMANSVNVSYGPPSSFFSATSDNVFRYSSNISNAETGNNASFEMHVFDSYETITSNTIGGGANAKTYNDLQITNVGQADDPMNTPEVIVVGAGGAGGSTSIFNNTTNKVNRRTHVGPGGGGGQVVYYRTHGTKYSTSNITITLGQGGYQETTANLTGNVFLNGGDSVQTRGNLTHSPAGGNTTFGFHETSGNIIAFGGYSGSNHYANTVSGTTTHDQIEADSTNADNLRIDQINAANGISANANITNQIGGGGSGHPFITGGLDFNRIGGANPTYTTNLTIIGFKDDPDNNSNILADPQMFVLSGNNMSGGQGASQSLTRSCLGGGGGGGIETSSAGVGVGSTGFGNFNITDSAIGSQGRPNPDTARKPTTVQYFAPTNRFETTNNIIRVGGGGGGGDTNNYILDHGSDYADGTVTGGSQSNKTSFGRKTGGAGAQANGTIRNGTVALRGGGGGAGSNIDGLGNSNITCAANAAGLPGGDGFIAFTYPINYNYFKI